MRAFSTTLGEIYREEREYDLARDAFKEAVTQEPGLEATVIGLALSHLSLGENTEAADALNRLIMRGVRSGDLLSVIVEPPPSMIRIDVLAEMAKLTRSQNEDPIEFSRL